ncbi:hypothetical protein [Nocardia wallacei]|uniref:hypothetical protein n=1 Tax=Nocardia wallacei TaxID=480035 RepID=UPI00245382CF|nr:hypothetical protein [Nocardia wallacei]
MDEFRRFADLTKSGGPYAGTAPSDVVYALAALAGGNDIEASHVWYTSEGRETTWVGLWLVPAGLIYVTAAYNEPNWTGTRESNAGRRRPSIFLSWYRRTADIKAIGINSIDGGSDPAGKQLVLHGEAVLELEGKPWQLTVKFGDAGSGASELLTKLRDRL